VGDLGDLTDGVRPGLGVQGGGDAGQAVDGQHRGPRLGWQLGDGVAGVFVDRPAHGVLHSHARIVTVGFAAEPGQPVQQLVGGAGAVGGDEQVVPPGWRDLGDGPPQQRDVVGGVVGPGGAGSELVGQALVGVVAHDCHRV